jgi:DNA/RNA-binding domain of Phe-tRNA-synthetase-like protein
VPDVSTLAVTIDAAVAARHPDTLVAWFTADEVAAAATALGDASVLVEEAERALGEQGLTTETLTADPRIAGWRDATKTAGLKPSAFRSSAEQLARRVLRGQGLTTPLPLVTAYCALSAHHVAPLAIYDRDRIPGPTVELRFARPDRDRFDPLGGHASDFPIGDQVVVYAAGQEILCWGINHRDSKTTSVSEMTSRVLCVGEAVIPEHHEPLRNALSALHDLLAGHGASVGPISQVTAP